MPTRKQLNDRWTADFLYGKEVYAETTNIRGSAYIGRTKGWYQLEDERKEMLNRRYSIHKKFKGDVERFS